MSPPISVLILTRNEERDLPGCLESLAWSDDVHVYDSCSTDATVDIATRFGAKVTQRPFDNWSTHQNWRLQNIPFKHPWVYYSDADERIPADLATAMAQAAANPGECAAFRVRRRDYLNGQWLRYTTQTPSNIRLFKPDRLHYERLVNPMSIVDGPIGDLTEHFDHFPFSKGMTHWLDKHNRYSTMEAAEVIRGRRGHTAFSPLMAFTARDFNERRFHQKELFYRMPCRPVVKFMLLYVMKRGFLDGRAGFTYAMLQSIYEYMIVLNTRELEAAARSEGAH